MRRVLKTIAIVACISFFGSVQALVHASDTPINLSTGDYQLERTVDTGTPPSGETLNTQPAIPLDLLQAAKDTVYNLTFDSPPGSDSIQQAQSSSNVFDAAGQPSTSKDEPVLYPSGLGDTGIQPHQHTSPQPAGGKEPQRAKPSEGAGPGPERVPPSDFDRRFDRREGTFPKRDEKLSREIEDLLEFISEERSLKRLAELEESSEEGEKGDPLTREFERKLREKIEALTNRIEADQLDMIDESNIIVLDAVNFTRQLRAIHQLLNPPARLHPWLKWLLYLNRITPEMLEFYQAALEKRDNIYFLASRSNGKLKIRYQGKIVDVPIFIWPDQAEGRYELVLVREGRTPVPYESSSAVPVPPNPNP